MGMQLKSIDLNITNRLRDHGFAVEYVAALEEAQRDSDRRYVARIAVLEAALREIAGGEISGHGEIVVRSDSMSIAHDALEKK
jgi:hypothetical protein